MTPTRAGTRSAPVPKGAAQASSYRLLAQLPPGAGRGVTITGPAATRSLIARETVRGMFSRVFPD